MSLNQTNPQFSAIDPSTGQAHKSLPSDVLPSPTEVDTKPQQASTHPGDGHEEHHAESSPGAVPTFKEQVIGYSQVMRGTVLGQTETKQHGKDVLAGAAPAVKPSKDTTATGTSS